MRGQLPRLACIHGGGVGRWQRYGEALCLGKCEVFSLSWRSLEKLRPERGRWWQSAVGWPQAEPRLGDRCYASCLPKCLQSRAHGEVPGAEIVGWGQEWREGFPRV